MQETTQLEMLVGRGQCVRLVLLCLSKPILADGGDVCMGCRGGCLRADTRH